jgi:hypothetical protein
MPSMFVIGSKILRRNGVICVNQLSPPGQKKLRIIIQRFIFNVTILIRISSLLFKSLH